MALSMDHAPLQPYHSNARHENHYPGSLNHKPLIKSAGNSSELEAILSRLSKLEQESASNGSNAMNASKLAELELRQKDFENAITSVYNLVSLRNDTHIYPISIYTYICCVLNAARCNEQRG